MNLRFQGLVALAAALCTTSAFAQTAFPEVEPNTNKAEATTNGTITMTAGDALTGTTTGTTTTAASTLLTSVDQFRIKTAALPLGIYKHTLSLTSTIVGHTGSIRGLNQTGTTGTASTGGTPGTLDNAVQTSSTATTPARFNQWYGFGKQEELYYRVTGTTATTDAYAAVLATSTVPFAIIAPAFESSAPITIATTSVATVDTDFHVYDSNLDAIAGFDNDDEGPAGPTLQSRIIRTFAPGTYYLAMGRSNSAWNIPSPPDEDFFSNIMDFPGSLVCASTLPTTTTDDRDLWFSAANGIVIQSNQVAAPDSYSVQWYQFTVAAGAPPIPTPAPPANDACASAIALPFAAGTTTGIMIGATNDGTASCDPGGAASRDVWYSWTNTAPSVRILSVSTCGTTGLADTVVSVYGACGGAELGCNDDNGACTAQPLSSLVSGINVNPAQTVIIRISDKGLGGTGVQPFSVVTTVAAPPPPNDDCATPIIVTAGTYPFDTTGATTGTQGQGTTVACGTTTSVKKDLWYTYTPSVSGSVTIATCTGIASTSTDTKISYYNGAGCPAAASPVGCDDDGCVAPNPELASTLTFPVTCGSTYTIQLGNFSSSTTTFIFGTFTVTESGTPCATPSTVFCDGSLPGACAGCVPNNNGAVDRGCANSSFAAGTELVTSGVASVSADTLVLTTNDMPGPGLFFQSNGLGSVNPFGDGMLCAAVGIIRMGVVFPTPTFSASYPGGLTPNPISIAGAPIAAGDVKNYQVWYRDSVAFCSTSTFNTSNGRTLTWGP